MLVVAAAGNDGVNADSEPDYPAALRPAERDLGRSHPTAPTGSPTSPTTERASVDLAAPGEDIYSTVPTLRGAERLRDLQRHVDGGALRERRRRALPVAHPAGDRRRRCAAAHPAVGRPAAVVRRQDRHGRPAQRGTALGAAPRTPPEPATDRAVALRPAAPRNRLHEPAAAHCGSCGSGSRDAERHPALPALRRRPARRKTVRDKDGPGGRDPKPDAQPAAGGRADTAGSCAPTTTRATAARADVVPKRIKQRRCTRSRVLFVGR